MSRRPDKTSTLGAALIRNRFRILHLTREIRDLGIDEERLREDPASILEIASEEQLLLHGARATAANDPNVWIELATGFRQHSIHRTLQQIWSEYPRSSIDAPREHGKSTQIQLRIAWELGRNPAHMVGYFSCSDDLPVLALGGIRHVLESDVFRAVFPSATLRRANDHQLVMDRSGTAIHPSVVGMGILGSGIGRRCSILVLDDILDLKNTYSETTRRKVWLALTSTHLQLLLANGRLWDIGTPWHLEDARHQLRRLPGIVAFKFDATDGRRFWIGKAEQPIPGGDPASLWPELTVDDNGQAHGWPRARLEEKRKILPMLEFARQFRCQASAGALAIFDQELLEEAVAMGEDMELGPMPVLAGPSEPVFTGVDLAVGKSNLGDLTALHTGTIRQWRHGITRVTLDVRAGHWNKTGILAEFLKVLRLYPNHLGFCVENNAAFDFIVQQLANPAEMRANGWSDADLARLQVIPHTTGSEKHDPVIGIHGMSFAFESRQWAFPSGQEIEDTISGLLSFDGSGHTSDYVIAAWLFHEQIRQTALFAARGADSLEAWGVA